MGTRGYLGRESQPMGQRYTFLLPDSVEVDNHTYTEIVRTRVFFDDVVAVTHHRYRGTGFLIVCGLAAAGFGVLAAWAGSEEPGLGWFVFGVLSAPFALAFLLRLAFGVDMVGVYGRRTFTRMRFGFRKARAREVYETLVRAVTEHQDRARSTA